MGKRLHNYQEHMPWWGWCNSKPDLRFYGRKGVNGTRRVRLELEIPASRILLSCEPAWVAVLNDIFIPYTYAEGEMWDVNLEKLGINDQQRPLPEPWQSQLIASWERIFDLPGLRAGNAWSDIVQATFEELRLEDVVQVKSYTIRSSVVS